MPNKYKIVAICILSVFAGLVIGLLLKPLTPENIPNPLALSLTDPVYQVHAKVISKDDDRITVQVIPTANTSNDNPTTLSVLLTDSTAYNRKVVDIPIFYNMQTPTPPRATKDDIGLNQIVTIHSANDLRTLQKNEFIAQSITLPSYQTYIRGVVSSISGSEITLQVTGYTVESPNSPPTAPQLRPYTFLKDKNTAFFLTEGNEFNPNIKESDVSKFANGDRVDLITNENINNNTTPHAIKVVKLAPPMH